MKAIITGLRGTVAPALARALTNAGHVVVPWDRTRIPIDDPVAARNFIRAAAPDWFFHVATGSPQWAELVAQVCGEQRVRFLFTSSVSVFSAAQSGPFAADSLPQPDDDYGRYKLACERLVRAANPEACVARIGWQIGDSAGGNHMLDHLERTFAEKGRIDASLHWYQACSFLPDTAASLLQIVESQPAGLYHVDGNPGLNFHEIVTGLNRLHGNRWKIYPNETPVQNNLLTDPRVTVQLITARFDADCRTPVSQLPSPFR